MARPLDRISGFVARAAEGWASFRREVAVSGHPESASDVLVVGQQLAISRQSSWTTTWIIPVASVLIAYASRNSVPESHAILWPLLVAVACFGSEIAYVLLTRDGDPASAEAVRRRARVTVGMTVVTSTAWALQIVLLWAPGEPVNHMLLILVIASTISGWVSLGASHLATALAPMPVYLAVLFIMPLTSDDLNDTMLAFLCAGYWVIMTGLLYTNYKTRERMLKLENERGVLVHSLQAAKAESDRARDRAESASRAKSSFLANMSHELRTPLNAILGFSEIIHTRALGAEAADQYAEYGGFIHDSGRHLLALISDILDLAKIEAGRLTLREEEIDLGRMLGETLHMITVKADAGGLMLARDTAPNLPHIYGDERALRQIVVNLLSNAVKFTPRGGQITVFCSMVADGGIAFGVNDTGVGIEPADLLRVFENFGQGRHDAVIADQGTGLGLPIVKGLAEAHGGTIALESTPGRGTRVTVSLPAARVLPRRAAA